MFNVKKIDKNLTNLEEGIQDSEDENEEQKYKMSVLENQSNFSFFDSLVDKALIGEFNEQQMLCNFNVDGG